MGVGIIRIDPQVLSQMFAPGTIQHQAWVAGRNGHICLLLEHSSFPKIPEDSQVPDIELIIRSTPGGEGRTPTYHFEIKPPQPPPVDPASKLVLPGSS